MPRVFACIATAHVLLLMATAAIGMLSRGVHTQRHVALAVFTLLLGCLLQIVAFMYFAVSGKMMRQAVHIGRLDPYPLVQMDRRRRNKTIVLALFFVSVVMTTATGAAHWRDAQSRLPHLLIAWSSAIVQIACWVADFRLVSAHSRVFEGVMLDYARRRREPGATTNPASSHAALDAPS